jgi:hypothetical protein
MRSLLPLALVVGLLVLALWAIQRRAGRRGSSWVRGNAEVAVVCIFAILLPIAIWHVVDTHKVIPSISKLVVPYPGADEPMSDDAKFLGVILSARDSTAGARLRPRIDSMKSNRNYFLHTTDPPVAVMRFYRDSTKRPGWTVTTDEPEAGLMILRRGDEELTLAAGDQGYGRGTVIIYSLQIEKH